MILHLHKCNKNTLNMLFRYVFFSVSCETLSGSNLPYVYLVITPLIGVSPSNFTSNFVPSTLNVYFLLRCSPITLVVMS